jgi:hypothetical protein
MGLSRSRSGVYSLLHWRSACSEASGVATTSNVDASYLNAELDVAFAMLNLANLAPDYETTVRHKRNACDIYHSVTDLLSRLILEDPEQQNVRKRLDELREWLELRGARLPQPQSPRS